MHVGWPQGAEGCGLGLPPEGAHPILSLPGLWNLVFLFSNMSLVFLMPFAYFFTESEGFAGSKKVRGPTGPVPHPVSLSLACC